MSNSADSAARIGLRVAAARRALGWDKAKLARRAAVSATYVGRLERGAYKQPSLDRLDRIATALGLRVSDLAEAPIDLPADLLDEVREACVGHEELLRRLLADVRRYPPEQRAGALEFALQAIRLHLGRPEPLNHR